MITEEQLKAKGYWKETSEWRVYMVNADYSVSLNYTVGTAKMYSMLLNKEIGTVDNIEDFESLEIEGYKQIYEYYQKQIRSAQFMSRLYEKLINHDTLAEAFESAYNGR